MTRVAKTRSIDMTSGPLFGKILWFMLPLIATNLLQMLYNAADIMVVGLSSNPYAVGAVGSRHRSPRKELYAVDRQIVRQARVRADR